MKKLLNKMVPLQSVAAAVLACLCIPASADHVEKTLPAVEVEATRSIAEKNQLPATTESVTAQQVAETINAVNTEDALKYLPSVLIRKRHIGDTQAPMATRTSGVGASARSLIYADGVLLSPLIANNNTIGGPRWGMVAPEEIERIDLMYGPFSAAYAGNSIGAVTEITTRMPEKFEAGAKLQMSRQDFSQYGTQDSYVAKQGSALLGNRSGPFVWWFSANHLDSSSHPLAYVTVARPAAASGAGTPVTGAFADTNRTGSPIFVLGAGGFERQLQDNVKFKLAYDIHPTLRAAYTVGLFQNDTSSTVQSYLCDAAGNPVYSGSVNIGGTNPTIAASAFSNNVYAFREEHLMQSLSLKSSTRSEWDWEAVASHYNYDTSVKRVPGTALPAAQNGGAGTIEYMDDTGWSTLDLKAFWRPQGLRGAHQVSFGAHYDRTVLANSKYNTSDWIAGVNGALATESRGKTQTQALWLQDAWRIDSRWRLTLGGRYEQWRAFDGFNYSQTPALSTVQPNLAADRFSPKAALAWDASHEWLISASLAKAYRFPTVAELYQAVTSGATITSPNPNLKPENALSSELAFERTLENGKLRISLFQENIRDALLSQSSLIGSTTFTFVQNVEQVRSRGIELVAQKNDVLLRGLDWSGSVTYVDSRVLQDSANAAAVGKRTPQIPDWRATLVATYRANQKLATTLALRYSGKQYGQIDNLDTNGHTYQGFEAFFVADLRLRYQIDKQWTVAAGIDNLNNEKYFLFHPFPQRTLFAELKFAY